MAGSKEDFIGIDPLDRMHALAKQGASLATLCRRFKQMNPHMLQYWMRQNGYARNGLDYPST